MIYLITILFWVSSFLVAYPYVIYPLLLVLINRLGYGKGWKSECVTLPADSDKGTHPSVTMIIAAYNEQSIIAQKIDNALQLGYSGKLEIIVISDGSTDDTADIVESYSERYRNVKLVRMTTQSGKTLGLNTAVPQSSGEFLVFTDANALYDSDALSQLLVPFEDGSVGYTVGSALYLEEDVEAVNVSEGLYWRYELAIKKLESAFHSVVGGDGAIYAIRRSLYSPLESYDISDFVNPLQIISKGFRGVFVPEARSFEGGTAEFADEFRRKRRIVNRSWGAVRRNWKLFSWSKNPEFLFMLLSHKVIRWWSFPLVLVALLSCVAICLISGSLFYLMICLIIVSSIVVGFLGWRLDIAQREMPKMVYLLYYFYLVSLSGMLGIVDDLRGQRQSIWQPTR